MVNVEFGLVHGVNTLQRRPVAVGHILASCRNATNMRASSERPRSVMIYAHLSGSNTVGQSSPLLPVPLPLLSFLHRQ